MRMVLAFLPALFVACLGTLVWLLGYAIVFFAFNAGAEYCVVPMGLTIGVGTLTFTSTAVWCYHIDLRRSS